MYGGVEAGGTKFICAIGRGPDEIVATDRVEVTEPGPTIAAAVRFFEESLAAGQRIDALGIASFGPVELRPDHRAYGSITTTPKAGWSGVDVIGPFRAALGIPIAFETDVNGAALAEGRWGAARDVRSFVYLTLGTGIGGGAVVEGSPVHGLVH